MDTTVLDVDTSSRPDRRPHRTHTTFWRRRVHDRPGQRVRAGTRTAGDRDHRDRGPLRRRSRRRARTAAPRDDRYHHAHGSAGHGADHVLPRDRRAHARAAGRRTASRCSACGRASCSSTSTATTRAARSASASWPADVADTPYLVSRLQGFGTTIFAEMSALAVATGSINLGQGFPDTDGPPEVNDAAVAAIRPATTSTHRGSASPSCAPRSPRTRRSGTASSTTPTPRCS